MTKPRSLPDDALDTPRGKIMRALSERSPRPASELAKAVGLNSGSAVGYHLKALLKAGRVVKLGGGNTTRYALPGTRAKEEP